MQEKQKNHVVYTDDETHHELSIMAATKKVSIKQCLKEIVEREKVKGIIMDPRSWTKEMQDAWHSNIPDIQKAFEALKKTANGKTWNEDSERWE